MKLTIVAASGGIGRLALFRAVAERGTAAMCEAMRATGVRRIVAISAAPIGQTVGLAD
ncbi:hypothetical protein [Streptomyces sp. HUAS TT7]|uniref:hypothetical protein n=1 Tax=Streptomyces sp. HUAS TT7 TaxID=3447507 RepID=UPI003F65FDFE